MLVCLCVRLVLVSYLRNRVLLVCPVVDALWCVKVLSRFLKPPTMPLSLLIMSVQCSVVLGWFLAVCVTRLIRVWPLWIMAGTA